MDTIVLDTFFTFISNRFSVDISKVKELCLNKNMTSTSQSLQPPSSFTFEKFFEFISQNYPVDIKKVKEIYNTKKPKPLTKKEQNAFANATLICENLPELKHTIASLKEICKNKGLKVSGTKDELIQRINNPSATDLSKNISRKKKILFKTEGATKIIDKMRGSLSCRAIRKNAEGHYVDLETQMVFHPISKKVYAKWDNRLNPLTKEDIKVCIDMNFEYILPENLDNGMTKVVDKIVEETLEGDDFKDEESEEEDDEEEEDDDE